jgi:tripartite-type tricarboxylate transporter receptor subunit TctC
MKVNNAEILAELWSEDKAFAVNAKALIKTIKAATKKPTKKDPDKIIPGELTLYMPKEFIGEALPDAWGGKDMWVLFKIDPKDWDAKKAEIEGRTT